MKVDSQFNWVTRFRSIEERCDQLIATKSIWWVSGFSIVYFAVTGLIAARRPIWTDEFFTLFISRAALYKEFWNALLTGADQHPPLFYLITHASLSLFGESELALRFPAIVGFWLFCVSIYIFARQRISVPYSFAAMVFPLATGAYLYAYEARGYALVLAFTGTSLVCWQATANAARRKYASAGLALSLFAAVGSHYYALLLLPPLILGELIRTYSQRRLNIAVWLAFSAAFIPLIASWPA